MAPFSLRNSDAVTKPSKCNWQMYTRPRCTNSHTGRLYNGTLILVQLYIWLFVAEPKQSDVTYPGKSKMTTMFEFFLAICGNAAVVVIWAMYIIKQTDLMILINRLTEVDATLDRVNGKKNSGSRNNYLSKNCLILLAMHALMLIISLLVEHLAFHEPLIIWFRFVVPSVTISWFHVQYFLALQSIETRFRYLNVIFRDCAINSIVFPLRYFLVERATVEDLQIPKIVSLRRAHTSLHEISCGLANFYSLPMLLSITFVNFLSLYNAYYLFVPYIIKAEEHTCLMSVNSICWLVVLMTPIIMIANGVSGVTSEMKRTADVIPNLLTRPTTNTNDKIELKKFCFDLLHKNIEFTAYNFFPLDGTLVQSMIGMVASYLTIIIQLQAESSNSASHGDRDIRRINKRF